MNFKLHVIGVVALLLVFTQEVKSKLGTKDFMACGGLSTAITDLLLFPLDTIKVTQQSSKQAMSATKALQQILNGGGGVTALYKGALGYATMDGVGAAMFFAVYERMKRFTVEDLQLKGSWLGASVYGSAAAAFGVSSIILVPAELIKARMQTQGFSNLGQCLRDAVARERGGFMGLYTGYAATMVRDLPYFALQLGFYDNIKDALTGRFSTLNDDFKERPHRLSEKKSGPGSFQERFSDVRMSPAVIDLVSGISAGFLTGLLTNPMDVITARLMTQKADMAKNLLPGFRASVGAPYKGLADCVVRMAREEGPRSFLIGVKSRVGWIAPFTAISLGLNNYLRRRVEESYLQAEMKAELNKRGGA